jgi:hypothetical protein
MIQRAAGTRQFSPVASSTAVAKERKNMLFEISSIVEEDNYQNKRSRAIFKEA